MAYNQQKSTVLICEDDPVTNRMLSARIKKFGYEVVGIAENGLEALNLINEKKPAIVLLDINMPMGSGLTVLRFIRECKMQSKVIMLTSDDSPDSVHAAKKLGVDDYLIKPSLDTNRFFEALRRISEPVSPEPVNNEIPVPESDQSTDHNHTASTIETGTPSDESDDQSESKKHTRMARAERESRGRRR